MFFPTGGGRGEERRRKCKAGDGALEAVAMEGALAVAEATTEVVAMVGVEAMAGAGAGTEVGVGVEVGTEVGVGAETMTEEKRARARVRAGTSVGDGKETAGDSHQAVEAPVIPPGTRAHRAESIEDGDTRY